MATFSKKERVIAAILSATPGLKAFLKNIYISINAKLHKKEYIIKVMEEPLKIHIIDPLVGYDAESETFGGYYDIATVNNRGQLLSHISSVPSVNLPSDSVSVDISITDIHEGTTKTLAKSKAYNWQQGTRLHWLNEELFVFNDFNEDLNRYESKVFSAIENLLIKTFNYPVQAVYKEQYFLSINYQRLLSMRPDYGYRSLPPLNQSELTNLKDDGIWKIDYASGDARMLHTIEDVANVERKDIFKDCTHKLNHLIIQPNGKGFMFIHRYFQGKRRFDRLMYSDFKTLKVLIDEEYVSHCYWIDNETILGYLKANGENGYYYLGLDGVATLCSEMTALQLGDGHPSSFGDWIVFDSYPDKSRMQKLYLFNMKTKQLYFLAELFQSTKYKNETRCDLHPRFSTNGKYISFDTVYQGKRRQLLIDISSILSL
ncbi:hypothetical protein [Maribacter sp. R86514]|uniref:hypothetical protein n=1 Tax=Maribacter sp. R86514 TaxID=3093854 RepID=UPI0037CAAFA9